MSFKSGEMVVETVFKYENEFESISKTLDDLLEDMDQVSAYIIDSRIPGAEDLIIVIEAIIIKLNTDFNTILETCKNNLEMIAENTLQVEKSVSN